MRQAGIIAAAGIYALENNISRLADDHENAVLLGKGLADVEELEVDLDTLQTNMVFFRPKDGSANDLSAFLQDKNILVDAAKKIRLVTHMQVSKEDVQSTIDTVKAFYQ